MLRSKLATLPHGVAGIDREIDQGGLELGDVGNRKAIGVRYVDLDPDPCADQWTHELRDRVDLGADIEHLRFQRLPSGKRQQLPGQLGGAFDGIGDRVDVTAAALVRQVAAAKEVGGGTDDRQQVVEIVRDAPGQLTDGLHFLRLAQRFLALAPFGDVDRFRHRADDSAMARSSPLEEGGSATGVLITDRSHVPGCDGRHHDSEARLHVHQMIRME